MFLLGKVWELDLCILNFRIDMNINGNGFCFLVGSTCLLTNLVESIQYLLSVSSVFIGGKFLHCPRNELTILLVRRIDFGCQTSFHLDKRLEKSILNL